MAISIRLSKGAKRFQFAFASCVSLANEASDTSGHEATWSLRL